jgi:uncharacterized protein YigA (DUF484 family)
MVSADDLVRFLQQHPDFFEQHPDLFEQLNLPHGGGGAVSLVERQVKVLRERQVANRERLAELVRVARGNDLLAARTHQLALRLLRARTKAEVRAHVETSMREDFEVSPVRFLLNDPELADPALQGLESLLAAGKPRCGHFAEAQRTALFGDFGPSIASMAIVPAGHGAVHGALVLGSEDPHRFNPAVSTDFLARIGEMIGAALARCADEPRM